VDTSPTSLVLLVLDWPSLMTSSNFRKTGIASAASPEVNSGRPAVDGLLPVGSAGSSDGLAVCRLDRCLVGRSVEILLSMETPLQPQLSDASCTLFPVSESESESELHYN
jgi:hypothetical protein